MTSSNSRRRFLTFAGAAVAGTLLAGCVHMSSGEAASARDYSTERVSDQSAFRVSYRSDPEPVPVGRLHTWTLHVARADGTPVDGARIDIEGDMPEHGHGLPTRPRVTQALGNGDYVVDGLKFQMSGWWAMDFTVTAEGQTDKVHFNLLLRRSS